MKRVSYYHYSLVFWYKIRKVLYSEAFDMLRSFSLLFFAAESAGRRSKRLSVFDEVFKLRARVGLYICHFSLKV